MLRRSIRLFATPAGLSALLLCLASPALADVSGLYSTGVSATGAVVSDTPLIGLADLHYSLVSSPLNTTPTTAYVVQSTGFPIPPWHANDAAGTMGGSKWISGPGSPPTNPTPNGIFDYQTTFTSTSTAAVSFAGFLTADDQATLTLNGVQVASTTGDQVYATLFAYNFTSALKIGTNTIDILVNNTHNAVEGARLSIQVVPEPSSVAMGLGASGLLGLAGFARRRFSKV